MKNIPKGYKQTELGILPKEWEVVRLGEICEIKKDKFNPLNNTTLPCVELEHISQNTGILLGFTDSSKQLSVKNYFSKGEILFGKLRPYLRKFWKATFNGVCSSEIWVFRGNKSNNDFLFYLIQSEHFIQMANLTTGTKMPRADWNKMKYEYFPLPPLKEQEKIAEILSTADTQIQNLEKLISHKERYKKGLMQKLFSQTIRFKGFNDKWEVVRLGKVCGIQNGFAFEAKKFKEQGNPIIRITNIQDNIIKTDDLIYFSYDDYKYIIFDNYKIINNDVVVAMSGASTGKIGIYKGEEKLFLNQRVGKFEPTSVLNPRFLYYFLLTKINFIYTLASGGAQPNLSAKALLKKIQIPLPPLQEQQKIAEVLSVCDDEVQNLKAKLELLKKQKQALMQKLLSGKVRVKI